MAKFGLGAVGHLARKVAGPAPEREQIAAQREEEGEHWQSVGGQRIPPGAERRRIEKSASVISGELAEMRTDVQSPQVPPKLSNCNEHPFLFHVRDTISCPTRNYQVKRRFCSSEGRGFSPDIRTYVFAGFSP